MRLPTLLLYAFIILWFPGFIVRVTRAVQIPSKPAKTIKIGLLIQDNNSLAAKQGAEMAIRSANEKGGFKGRPFQLVVRSMEGPWGTGSKQAVDLIFNENVCAIVASSDGRNGHLIEQVSTKTRIVYLSVWSSDPTLAQAFVPWYFTCIPNDFQQADAFINEIYNKRKLISIATISDSDYDSRLSVESLIKKIRIAGKKEPVQLYYDDHDRDFNETFEKLNKAGVDGIILFGKPSASIKFLARMEKRKIKQPVFGALSLLNEDESSMQEQEEYRNVILLVAGNWYNAKGLAFRKEYQRLYGNVPGAVAAYSYDGMSLLIDAIRNAGEDREAIQKWLTKMHFGGVTGSIQFDDKGKRMGTPGLMEIKNGIPVPVER